MQAVESRGPDALRAELLVGFDPLPQLLSALEGRFGKRTSAQAGEDAGLLAALCADSTAGQQVVGIKWAPEAFVPSQPRVGRRLLLFLGSLAFGRGA